MGRDISGMEDEGPIAADACINIKMPSFISSSFEEGRLRLSRNIATESNFTDGKVERDLSRSDSDGGEEKRSSEEEEEEKGNNNNNCNGGGGGGGERRRASAVEILRRNFGVSKSPSLPTLSDFTPAESVTSHRYSDASKVTSVTSKEHVYCTVYCVANDSHLKDGEITDDDTDAPQAAAEMDEETEDAGSSPAVSLYTLDDLVDPFGYVVHRLSMKEQAGAETSSMQICRVCLEEKTIAPLPCCRKAVCDECLKLYVSSQVRVAKSYISCPIPECSGYLEEGVVISHLANEDVAKYRYFLELSQLDSSTKPCPQCSEFTSLKASNLNRSEHKYKIQCSNCQFVWCFKCHAPWHSGVKCREYRKGDKLLRSWASVIEHGQRNAQKCPKCKIHIQRTEGCDHMTCTQCNTNFCYRCGERYRHLRFFGDHTSNLSVFGCKYRYLPDKPHLRRLIRGSVCATKVLIAPVAIVLVVVLGALALVIGLVAFPVYYVCKRRKKQRTQQGSGRWI
ncbi:E3 ubiquitin-protein ligase RNF217 [Sebastes fasciatus]|uniref:E3 ubiquitin-protein ligase RNF217 n=1 Tax=Sebastes fasciatus TaxID=394691 RepID=UPI003D9E19C6